MANVLDNILKINAKIIVSLLTCPGDDYDSRIEDVQEDRLEITLPTRKGCAMPVFKNSKIHISVLTEKGRIGFESQIRGIVTDQIRVITIAPPKIVSQEQLREFFRVPVYMRTKVFIGSLDNLSRKGSQKKLALHESYVEDLSGGGCRINISAEEVTEKDTIVIDFSDTPIDIGLVQAQIVRVIGVQGEKYSFSTEFIDIEEQKRDKIVRFIFRRQLDLRNLVYG